MPEVKRSPVTPDRSLSHSRCNHAIGISKISALGGEIRHERACAASFTHIFCEENLA